jgi:hypothetical protein
VRQELFLEFVLPDLFGQVADNVVDEANDLLGEGINVVFFVGKYLLENVRQDHILEKRVADVLAVEDNGVKYRQGLESNDPDWGSNHLKELQLDLFYCDLC